MINKPIKLTEYSHGSGCGCKIDPKILAEILKTDRHSQPNENLLVGNATNDDAAVYKINKEEALISSTDFFTPIVNDAFTFGQIAAANAVSDIFAMGGQPMMALAILGWPVQTLPVALAQQVLEGARSICRQLHIPLAGGHSIDTKEPIFGLSVNGRVQIKHLKKNDQAQEKDLILLTKPLGVGILAAAEKRKGLTQEERKALYHHLTQLNLVGSALGKLDAVHAMTDVTGFGLAGHLIEMADNSNCTAILNYQKIPQLKSVKKYMDQNVMPDATYRNWNAVSSKIKFENAAVSLEGFKLLPDPQTNGGLLLAVRPDKLNEVQAVLKAHDLADFCQPIGEFSTPREQTIIVQ